MQELGVGDYDHYYEMLTTGPQGWVEWEVLVDRLTVHETRFFRDPKALELIRDTFLPRWLEVQVSPLRLQAWSVGCATGEEPYSLAMVIDQALSEAGRDYLFGVTATDISAASVTAGRRGVYKRARLKQVPTKLLMRYFEPIDHERYKVRDGLRERVCFSRANVLEYDTSVLPPMDLIVCQNLLIYFQRQTRLEVLNKIANQLRPGGLLVLGGGEILNWHHPELEPLAHEGCLAFRRNTTAVAGEL
jgi:chemotaxis methyl-accepting protein methylase